MKNYVQPDSRRGAVLAIVIVTLIVISLMVASLVQTIADERLQTRLVQQRQQARWLARAASDRALQSLGTKPDYTGEEWQISSELLPAKTAHQAIVVVNREPANPNQRNIDVTIFALHGETKQVLCQTQRTIQLPSPGGSP